MIIDYCPSIVEPPQHLSVAFFEEVTENALREANLKIQHIKLTMGSSIGENYCSQIYRVKIEYKLHGSNKNATLSVIVKSMPHREAVEFLQDLRVFQKEKIMYNEILPRLQMFLEGTERFSARLYHSLKYPVNTLVFEDLSCSGYEMASRETGLDAIHARLVIQRLAKFHASSMWLAKKDPEILKPYKTGMLARVAFESSPTILRLFSSNALGLLERIKQWPDYEDIQRKLQLYVENLRENLCRTQEPRAGELRVLNHGDPWVNNFLFKYNKQRIPLDVIFVDYQMSVWGSPGIDLNYFFFTSLRIDILKQKREELLKEYHHTLRTTLKKLNYDNVPSYEQICEEVRKRAAFGFFANFAIYPLISMDKDASNDSNLDNLVDEEFARNKMTQIFASKRLEEVFKYTLREFDKLGVWD